MFAFGWIGSALASCAATCACNACGFASREVMRRSARLAYCFLFTLAMILAWILRDFAKPLMEKLPCKFVAYLGLSIGFLRQCVTWTFILLNVSRDCVPWFPLQ